MTPEINGSEPVVNEIVLPLGRLLDGAYDRAFAAFARSPLAMPRYQGDVVPIWKDPPSPSALPRPILRRIQQFMKANISGKVTLSAMARISGYSQAHFLRMFTAATGLTPHQYLLEQRILFAQQLLRKEGWRLIDIAAYCGFSSESHLATVFRRQLGVTPTQYRRSA